MANCKHVLTALALLVAGPAFAGYAQMAPPGEWSHGNKYNVPKVLSVNDVAFWTRGNITAGGRAVSVPARLRFAANSPRFAAGYLFRSPAARFLPGVGQWLTLAGVASWVWDEVSRQWTKPNDDFVISDGYEYKVSVGVSGDYFLTPEAACLDGINPSLPEFLGLTGGTPPTGCRYMMSKGSPTTYGLSRRGGECAAGWYIVGTECVPEVEYMPIGEGEFLDGLEGTPLPDAVPGELPGQYPVEMPQISPMWVPSGAPRHNPDGDPNYDPEINPEDAPYVQPGVQIEPANTPESPWQVDVQPRDLPLPDGEPVLDPMEGGPGGPGLPPTLGAQDLPGLCDQYPTILACQTVDSPDAEELDEKPVDFDFEIEEGFLDNATCPQPIEVTVGGQLLSFSWQPFCDSLVMIRSILLALAWASAAFIMIGAHKGE